MSKINKAIKTMCKFLQLKAQGKHPTRKKIVKFCRKYKNLLNVQIIRPPLGGGYFEDTVAGYYQYLLLSISPQNYHNAAHSTISFSTLPFRELIELFRLEENDFLYLYNEVHEFPPFLPLEEEEEEEDDEIEEILNAFA